MEECHRLITDQVDLDNPEGHRLVPDVRKPLSLGGPPDFRLEELVPSLWIKSERDYNISAAYGITHWWIKRMEYITRHSAPSDRHAVRSHMRILSKLNHLHGLDKVHLYNAINLWIKNIFIRQRVGDLQLSIESYHTMLNLTKPRWDALDFLFKEDYFIVSKPKAMIYRDRNDQKKMLKENEVHIFSDCMLTRVLHELDYIVKDFKLYQYNPCMKNRIWSEDDKKKSEEFMEVIERRIKIQRIFLERFVGGIFRDVDYRTLNIIE
nr:hypothetical protein [Tanacetum cinerariifolium]